MQNLTITWKTWSTSALGNLNFGTRAAEYSKALSLVTEQLWREHDLQAPIAERFSYNQFHGCKKTFHHF